ncbi:hypothetical protein [Chryseolinea soli]|nr:hypothetical protein [Chryseolinea soli]
MSIWMILLVPNGWVTLIFLVLVLSPAIVLWNFQATKVRFGPDYIETATLFRKKRIYIKDVKKFGVFFAGQNRWAQITPQKTLEENSDNDLASHKIYITKSEVFDMRSFRPAEHVKFPYRKKLYLKVKEMIEDHRANANLTPH